MLLCFVALLLIAWTVEASGLFDWAAEIAARTARGRADLLLVNVLVAGMFVLVQALTSTGVTADAGSALVRAAGNDTLRASVVVTVGSALGPNVVNNLPMTSFTVEAIGAAPHLTGAAREAAVWGALLGDALGPNLSLPGSLATMLWLVLLRDRGLDVRAWDYVRVGLLVTPPMLLSAALLLAMSLR